MNREDIIRMAQETGVTAERVRDLERFAKLVAQHEREACARICDELQDDIATEPKHCAEHIRARGNT